MYVSFCHSVYLRQLYGILADHLENAVKPTPEFARKLNELALQTIEAKQPKPPLRATASEIGELPTTPLRCTASIRH
jgi:hypothetical protein